MTEGKDQAGKIKRKAHLITSPHFFNSVLINPPVHFSFIILILLYSSQSLLLLFWDLALIYLFYTLLLFIQYTRHWNHYMWLRNGEKVSVPFYCWCWCIFGMELKFTFSQPQVSKYNPHIIWIFVPHVRNPESIKALRKYKSTMALRCVISDLLWKWQPEYCKNKG